jgi:hypothetical protein
MAALEQALENRQEKRRRLARTGFRASDQVAACPHRMEDSALDGRRPHESEVAESARDARIQTEGRKLHGRCIVRRGFERRGCQWARNGDD